MRASGHDSDARILIVDSAKRITAIGSPVWQRDPTHAHCHPDKPYSITLQSPAIGLLFPDERYHEQRSSAAMVALLILQKSQDGPYPELHHPHSISL